MISITKIAKEFNLSEVDTHKILLSHSNRIGVQLMAESGGKLCVFENVFDEIKTSKNSLCESVIHIGKIDEAASNKIPFDLNPYLYFLLSGGVIVYIGMTHCIAQRVGTHLKTKEFDSISCFPIRSGLSEVEAMNIHNYLPILNKDIMTSEMYFRLVLKQCDFYETE